MDVENAKQAAATAVQFLLELFGSDEIDSLLLEELEYNSGEWVVTVSFRRTGESPFVAVPALAALGMGGGRTKYYKVLRVATSGEVTSVKNRDDIAS